MSNREINVLVSSRVIGFFNLKKEERREGSRAIFGLVDKVRLKGFSKVWKAKFYLGCHCKRDT